MKAFHSNFLNQVEEITLVDIKNSKNSYSSDDKHCFLYGNGLSLLKNKNVKAPTVFNVEKIEVNGKMITLHRAIIEVEPNIFSRRDRKSIKEDKRKIYDYYLTNGFSDDEPDFIVDINKENHRKYIINYEKHREDNNYVLTRYDSTKNNPKDYIGGFDLEIIFIEQLISYVERGLVFGYIGHNSRKVWVDKLMAKHCLKTIKADDFACWLTSTDGRHFADLIELYVDNEDRETVEETILEYLPSIHDKAIIYNSPEHRGNLASSLEVFEKYKEMGMMMQETYTY